MECELPLFCGEEGMVGDQAEEQFGVVRYVAVIVGGVRPPSDQANVPDSNDAKTPPSGVIVPVVIISSGGTPSPMSGALRSLTIACAGDVNTAFSSAR